MSDPKFKPCKQCGEFKPLDEFRRYYDSRKGRYTYCKACESVNSRYKYLNKKTTRTAQDVEDLDKIETWYEMLREDGLKPPNTAGRDVTVSLDDLIATRQRRRDESQLATRTTPADLQEWLDKDLDGMGPEELEEAGDALTDKYRKIVGYDGSMPIYDETHRDTLNKVLARLDDAVDKYWEEHDE